MKKGIIITILAGLIGFLVYKFQYNPNPIIPRAELSDDADYWNVRISPDGTQIAYLSKAAGSKNIFLRGKKGNEKPEQLTQETGRGVLGMSWTYVPNYLVYIKDNGGDENHQLFNLNIKTKETKALTPGGKVKSGLVAASHLHPNEFIIAINDRDERHFDLYKMDVVTGKKDLVFLNRGGFAGFHFDRNLKLKLVNKFNETGGKDYFIHEGGGFLSPYITIPHEDEETTYPVKFDASGAYLYWASTSGLIEKERDKAALIKKPFNRPGPTEVLAESSKADIQGAVFSIKGNKPLFTTENYLKPKYIFFDNDIKKDIEFLQSQQNGLPVIISSNLDEDKMIVVYEFSDQISSYYLYDKNKKQLTELFNPQAKLAKYEFSEMHPVEIQSRDGLTLVSYLTLPSGIHYKNGKINKPVPMILLVHGGPTARDDWGFSKGVQRLANRGYAVLQVNYRGSDGFGKRFVHAGDKQHWDKVAEDIQDAANWAIDQKIADPKKVGIMGGSYGGYQTLVGLTKYPEFYTCGVDIVGMSNLVTTLQSMPEYWKIAKAKNRLQYGDRTTKRGRKELLRMSPISYVDRLQKPLLIGHGKNDPRVKKAESDQIVKAMREKGIPVTYVMFPDEGHGFSMPKNRMAFNAVEEKFLATYLGGRFEPIGNDLNESSMKILANDLNDKAIENRFAKPVKFIDHE